MYTQLNTYWNAALALMATDAQYAGHDLLIFSDKLEDAFIVPVKSIYFL